MRASTKQASVSRCRLPTEAGLASPGTGMGSAPGWLSFRRIVDIPFDACVAALGSWRLQEPTANCTSARAGCAGQSSTIPARGPAGSRSAWPGGRCARCCGCG
jgi:hypothetical protein